MKFLPILGLVCVLAGCNRATQSKEAIRQGVIEYVSAKGINVGAMDVDVTSIAFKGDEADASVAFRAKGSPAGSGGLEMRYTLEQKSGKWVVKDKAEAGNPHGGMGAPAAGMPPGHPPMGQAPTEAPEGKK